ncbi:MAG: hypothetical protein GY804_10915 [Alphaproteobacteria bacterium]|nr:hypothetical protein [Alphaproteobacteria bacterium]
MQIPKNRIFEIIKGIERGVDSAGSRVIKWKSHYYFSGMSNPVTFKNINDKQYAAKIKDDASNEWLVAFDGINIRAFTKKSKDGIEVLYDCEQHDAKRYAEEIRWLQGIAAQGFQCRRGFV